VRGGDQATRRLWATETLNKSVAFRPGNAYVVPMKPADLKRRLARKGATFQPGKGSHLKVSLGDLRSVLPMHGGDMPIGTFKAILKQLGLTERDLED
jgi:mRNA interferase HicA